MNESMGGRPMLMMGSAPAYLANLPRLAPPDNVQVIAKVTLESEIAGRIDDLGTDGGTQALTVVPRDLDLATLSPFADQQSPTVFRAAIGNDRGLVAEDASLQVDKVVSFAELPTDDGERPAGDLAYVVFGDADRTLYLAHVIRQAPDFDQVLVVAISGQHFTEAELDRQGRPALTIPGRPDDVGSRLTVGERVAGRTSAGQHFVNDVEVEVLHELRHSTDGLT